MAKRNMGLIIGLVAVVVIFLVYKGGSGTQSIYGTETMTRTAPSTVQPGQTFTLTYTAIGVSGMWGATIVESATGGCTFPSGGSTYQSAMLSDDGLTKTVSITAPQSGSCTFGGDYKFGEFAVKAFPGKTVTISGGGGCVPQTEVCNNVDDDCDGLIDEGNVCGGTCTSEWDCGDWSTCKDEKQTRTCTDLNSCTTPTNVPVTSKTCTTPKENSTGICSMMEWAKSIDEENYCTWGIAIIAGGVLLLILLTKK